MYPLPSPPLPSPFRRQLYWYNRKHRQYNAYDIVLLAVLELLFTLNLVSLHSLNLHFGRGHQLSIPGGCASNLSFQTTTYNNPTSVEERTTSWPQLDFKLDARSITTVYGVSAESAVMV